MTDGHVDTQAVLLLCKSRGSDLLLVLVQALAIKPEDKTCYVGRSRCYLMIGQPQNALKDAEASLKEDKFFFKVIYKLQTGKCLLSLVMFSFIQ